MAISASQVKELRDKTGAGMMDCKKALTESDGDFEKAIEILRKKGASVAAKRAERSATEGVVLTKIVDDGKTGIIVAVNCETDFVAKGDDFVTFSNLIMDTVVEKRPESVEALMALEVNGLALSAQLTDMIGKIGEKIEVSRIAIETVENGLVVDYVHHGSKLAVLLAATNVPADKAEDLTAILKDISMQIAAMNPQYLSQDDVPKEAIEKEIDIYKEIALKEGKPEAIVEKIALGKLGKFYQEVCLINQTYVKDNAKSVGDLIAEFNKANGTETKLTQFYRFHLSDEQK